MFHIYMKYAELNTTFIINSTCVLKNVMLA